MYETYNGATTSLHIGPTTGGQPAAFVGVRGAQWHPTRPGQAAWVAQLPTDSHPSLYTATVGPSFGSVTSAEQLSELPEGARLGAFGDWGYAIEWPLEFLLETEGEQDFVFSAGALTILDTAGVPQRTTVADLVAHGGEGTLLVIPRDAGFDISPYVDPALTGDVVVIPGAIDVVDETLTSLGVGFRITPEGTHFVSPDGEWLVEVVTREGGLIDVTAHGIRSSRTRSRGFPGPARPIGLASDGVHLLLQDLQTNELVMFGWDQGTLYRVPVSQGTVSAALLP